MDSWAFRYLIIKAMRRWLTSRTGNWESFFFYPDGRDCHVNVPRGKRLRVTVEIEDDPNAELMERIGYRYELKSSTVEETP